MSASRGTPPPTPEPAGVPLSAAPLLIGCGREAKPPAQAIDDWVRIWRGEVRIGQRPNKFNLPWPVSPVESCARPAVPGGACFLFWSFATSYFDAFCRPPLFTICRLSGRPEVVAESHVAGIVRFPILGVQVASDAWLGSRLSGGTRVVRHPPIHLLGVGVSTADRLGSG